MGARRAATVVALAALSATVAAGAQAGDGPRARATGSASGSASGPDVRTVTETRSGASAVSAADPLLRIGAGGPAIRPGFPVPVKSTSGTYYCCHTSILVGDVDGDPDLETILAGVAQGGITAVEPDGSPVPGWSDSVMEFHEYPTLIEADPARPGYEVALRGFEERTVLVDGHGRPLPGWPRTPNSGVWGGFGAAADLDGDGVDEYVTNDQPWQYDAFDSLGRVRRQGWPLYAAKAQQHLTSPLVVDLDRDGAVDVVGGASQMSPPSQGLEETAHAWSGATGADLPGWPVVAGFQASDGMVAGDLDGNGATEVVIGNSGLEVRAAGGALVRRMFPTLPYPSLTPPALADLDGDGRPEVVTVAHDDGAGATSLHAFRHDGTEAPGYPVALPRAYGSHTISPVVVGDLDGDGRQDVAFTMYYYDNTAPDASGVLAYDHRGRPLPGFPLAALYLTDHVPAIADTDRNGRNELSFVVDQQVEGWTDRLYSVEYPTGTGAAPQWGQDRGGPKRQGVPGQSLAPATTANAGATGTGAAQLVADLASGPAGSRPRDLTVLPGGAAAVLTADAPGSGRELWRTDGTGPGTALLKDLLPGSPSSRPEELTAVGSTVWFAATGADGAGRELWRTDGTAAGTVRVTDLNPGPGDADPTQLTAVGSKLFFVAHDGRERELWVVDGGAPHMVFDPTPADGTSSSSDPQLLVAAGDRLLFATFRERPELHPWAELGVSDGTGAGTTTWLTMGSHDSGEGRTLASNPGLRPAGGVTTSGGMAWLWTKNDLVAADSTRLQWSFPGLRDAYADYTISGAPAGAGLDALYGRTGELYRTTLASTLNTNGLLHDFVTDPYATTDTRGMPDGLARLGARTLMAATTPETGRELWSWEEGTGARLVADLSPGATDSDPVTLLSTGDTVLLRASTASTGDELWATDGTTAGTRRLTDLAAGPRGSHPGEALVVGSRVLMAADDGVLGRELWSVPLSALTVQPFTAAPTPTISGSARYGSTLTASAGAWSPAPSAFAWQWLREGVPITGATGASYVPVAADLGKRLSARVTASLAGRQTTTRTSAPTAAVVPATFTTTSTPTISGTARLKQVVTANAGSWAPTPTSFAYQWLRDGVAIPGATAATYAAVVDDVNHRLAVRVTGVRSGFTSVTRQSAATLPVTGWTFTTAPAPTVSGTPRLKQTVTADPGTWAPVPTTFAYQWYRDGVAISGATARSHTGVVEDVNHRLTVRVTAVRLGFTTTSRTSAPTALVTGWTFTTAPTPTVSGTARVGSTLTATTGTWSPTPTSFAHQWLRDGVAISGATARTYRASTTDAGHRLAVRVTAMRLGFTNVPRTSTATAAVAR